MTRILTPAIRNRAVLARQLLLERADLPIETAVDRVGGLQTQYAPSGYVGLWTRLRGFERHALTEALEQRTVVQATLMRTTIHVVSARGFWAYAAGVRQARRTWSLRQTGADEASMAAAADRLRAALLDGPRTVRELDGLAKGFLGSHGLWVDLVRVPPSGTWEHRRADRLALAEQWLGPCDVTDEEGRAHLVRTYLGAFGPAPWRDIASWAGVPMEDLARAAANVSLVRLSDEAGRELVDLPGAPLPDADTPAPVRFLPHWDALLLVHARRTGVLPEEHRGRVFSTRNPFSVGTYLVDGRVAGAWSWKEGGILLESFEPVDARTRDEIEAERSALERFHA